MAVLGRLTVPVGANVSGFSRGLARSAKLADSWSKKLGGKVDSAFSGSGKAPGGLAAGLDKLGKVTGIARTALAVGDVGRVAVGTAVGVGRLRLAFGASGEKADALRAKLDRTSAGLRAVRAASQKARFGLLIADVAAFGVKLGALAGGQVGKVGRGLLSIGAGGLKAASGLVRAGEAIGGVAVNAYRGTKAFGSFTAAVVKRDWGRAALQGFLSLQSGRKALAFLPALGSGLLGIATGGLKAGAGLLGVGKSLAGVAWNVASSGASVFARGLGGIASTTASVVAGLGKFAAVGSLIAVSLGVKAAAGAAHLQESFNATRQVFGEYSEGVLAAAEQMNAAVGTNKREFLEGANALGGLLQGSGYAVEDSAKLGVSLTKLAADMAAFRDIPFDQAMEKIRAGLSGEAEPLKALGILIDETTTKNYAMTAGIAKQGEELTNSQKVQSRLALITQGLGKDMGALSREATGPAAQMAEFWGRLQTLMDTIGATLAPILGAALQGINVAIVALGLAWEDGKNAVLGWFGVTNDSLGAASGGMGILQQSIGFIADAWGVVKGATAGFFSYFEAGLSKTTSWLVTIFEALEKLPGAGNWTGNTAAFLREYSEAAKTVSDDLWKTSQDAFAPKVAGSAVVNDYFAKAQAQIDAGRAALAGGSALPTDVAAPKNLYEVDKASKGKADPFGSAMKAGSAEAAATVLRSRYGAAGGKAAEKTEANTKATAKNTADIALALKNLPAQITGSLVPVPIVF